MSVYLIANLTIDDRERYAQYEQGFMEIFSQYPGELLAVDEEQLVLEGEYASTRTVLLRFPSRADALAWYESSEYQALAQHRFTASHGSVIVIDGLS